MTPYLLVVMTDGRKELIAQTIPNFLENASYPPSRILIFDDSADEEYSDWLVDHFDHLGHLVCSAVERKGFAGAYRAAWQRLSADVTLPDWCFFLEDDFLFNRPVDIQDMIDVLESRPYLKQMALRRQPWNAQEKAAGGVVEHRKREFTEVTDGPHTWLEHRCFFTCNPSIYRRSLTSMGWPQGSRSEWRLTKQLLQKRDTRFGYWGDFASGEHVHHIGVQRNGTGY